MGFLGGSLGRLSSTGFSLVRAPGNFLYPPFNVTTPPLKAVVRSRARLARRRNSSAKAVSAPQSPYSPDHWPLWAWFLMRISAPQLYQSFLPSFSSYPMDMQTRSTDHSM